MHRGAVVPCILVVSLLLSFPALSQTDTVRVNSKKLKSLAIASGVGYVAGIVVLNEVWYGNTARQPFAFFNDNAEWKQMDKAGHFFSSFYLSKLPAATLKSCNVPERKANMYGALAGFLLTIPIEVMDGFSDGYGASAGDALADAAGPVFFLAQEFAWGEIRIIPKLSFHRTSYAPVRPDLLGDDLLSEIVKDYNGQTQWLSFDIDKFTPFPKWLNLGVGYGGEEMVYARDSQNVANGYHPFRQFYLAIDIDLSAIKTRSRALKTLLDVVNIIHLPAPALEFSPGTTKFHPFYF